MPGADPDDWYGLLAVSTSAPLRVPGTAVTVSPSAVETITACPLRWALQSHGGDDSDSLASVTGSLVHALVERAAEGAGERELHEALDAAWASVDAGAPWFSRQELGRTRAMLRSFLAWRESSRRGAHRGRASSPTSRSRWPTGVTVRGRVDRLEVDDRGRPVIIDVKTGKNAVSRRDAEDHPQLAVYQLATALGAFAEHLAGPGSTAARSTPGGARLVYLSRSTAAVKERTQAPLDAEGVEHWRDTVAAAARATEGPVFTGQENDVCPRCPVRTACPVHASGRQVTARAAPARRRPRPVVDPAEIAERLGLRRPPRSRPGRRRAGEPAARRGRCRVGQDRDDGRAGGLAGRQRATCAPSRCWA